jgi:hypothetical protein
MGISNRIWKLLEAKQECQPLITFVADDIMHI